jgi:hypothetical protein
MRRLNLAQEVGYKGSLEFQCEYVKFVILEGITLASLKIRPCIKYADRVVSCSGIAENLYSADVTFESMLANNNVHHVAI